MEDSNFKKVHLGKRFLDIIYPPKCIFCNKIMGSRTRTEICNECFNKSSFITGKSCSICGKSIDNPYGPNQCLDCRETTHYFVKNIPVFEYKGMVREAIVRFKFFGKKRYAATLGILMAQKIKGLSDIIDFDIVTYIPVSRKRLMERGFNQAKLLCRVVAKELNLPIGIDVLQKNKDMPPQSMLNRNQRQKNIEDVFQKNPSYDIKDMTILLVDDVYTTGVTANECSKLLTEGGAKEVYVVTAAIGRGIY